MKVYEVTLTQRRTTEFVVETEAEAVEGALAEWEAEASAFQPLVSEIWDREATPDEMLGT